MDVLCHIGSDVCVCLSVYLYASVSVKATYRSVHQTARLRQRSANPVVNVLPSYGIQSVIRRRLFSTEGLYTEDMHTVR
jgi:hypothetical protein